MTQTGVVLCNLGGPDAPEAVAPFLRNLFSDPAIIALPAVFRLPLAAWLARRRAAAARGIYDKLGGASPLRANTEAQAAALETRLGPDHRVVAAMRYWHPFSDEAARTLKDWGAERVVVLPLYPQFSTTTTASSLAAWREAAARVGLLVPTAALCCWPTQPGFIAALAAHVRAACAQLPAGPPVRLLFSAHGLPERTVARGDPYPWQVEATADALRQALGAIAADSVVCYQSRVGPLRWIGPATDDEIRRAGAERRAVVVVPVAFVSEHSETLVELDIEYRHIAETCGVPAYARAATVGTEGAFIDGLARLVEAARERVTASEGGGRRCPARYGRCGCTA